MSAAGGNGRVRVLQSFPNKIGADRICDTAWHQAAGVAAAGGDVLVYPAAVHRPLPAEVRLRPTLARGRLRLPYRAVGKLRAVGLHDRIVARRLERLDGEVEVVHAWPAGARETLRTAARLGVRTVLERPNAHTRFAYEVVRAESERIGVPLPPGYEHSFDAAVLAKEEEEYALADYLLCPSDFVVRTFLDQGFPREKLLRHDYGYDEERFAPEPGWREREPGEGLTIVFAGVAAVRKGLHFALEAWLRSPASETGTFLVAGDVLPAYAERLADALAHPSVHVLGHRNDVPELMRRSDALVLPSIEEGFGIVCVEAMASACVPLASDACTDACVHGENALVHAVGDVDALAEHLTLLAQSPERLAALREAAVRTAAEYTWARVGERLLEAYRTAIAA